MAQVASRLRRGSATPRIATAIVIMMFVLFVVVLAGSIYRSYGDARDTALRSASAAAQVTAINARWITELSRQALARIDESLGPDITAVTPETMANISEAVSFLPGTVRSHVFDADGKILFSTDPTIRQIEIRDRDYFIAASRGETFHVSQLLLSRLDNGAQVFVFTRRLEREGDFAGAAIISFDAILLAEIWRSLDMDALSSVSFIRDDGRLVARFPLAEEGLDFSESTLFTTLLPRDGSGAFVTPASAERGAGFNGYQRADGTPLIALASLDQSRAMTQFWWNTMIVLIFAVPTAIALGLAIYALFRLLRRDERQRVQLTEALELNRMLVRDTHHRVKNNLQAIMSLVRLHGLPAQMKEALQHRISAMTAVHEHLYRLDQFTEVNASTLIPAIVDPLVETFGANVTVHYDIDAAVLDRDHATPLALVVNEVVTNALKYAFTDGRPGQIHISLKREADGTTVLTIADNGIGFDQQPKGSGLGMRLISAMLMQLGGASPIYTTADGTHFSARLDLDPAPSARTVRESERPLRAAE